jgi:hypothetical protein
MSRVLHIMNRPDKARHITAVLLVGVMVAALSQLPDILARRQAPTGLSSAYADQAAPRLAASRINPIAQEH